MKGKGCAIFLILLAGLIFAGAKFYLPAVLAEKQKQVNLIAGETLLNEGKVVEGISKLSQALIISKGYDKLTDFEKEEMLDLVSDTALHNPLKSGPLAEFVKINAITIDCEKRLELYNEFIKYAYTEFIKAKKETPSQIGETLYLAAEWADACKIPEKDLGIFTKVFNVYVKLSEADFQRLPWMDLALAGKPVAINPPAPQKPMTAAMPVPAKAPAAQLAKAPAPAAAPQAAPVDKQPAAAAPQKNAAKEKELGDFLQSKFKKISGAKEPPTAPQAPKKTLPEIASEINREIITAGVKSKDSAFAANGREFTATIHVPEIGTMGFWKKLMTVFDTVNAGLKKNGASQVQKITVKLSDPTGKALGTVSGKYSDYQLLKAGKIADKEFANRLAVIELPH